jgi:hypothetical protein
MLSVVEVVVGVTTVVVVVVTVPLLLALRAETALHRFMVYQLDHFRLF